MARTTSAAAGDAEVYLWSGGAEVAGDCPEIVRRSSGDRREIGRRSAGDRGRSREIA